MSPELEQRLTHLEARAADVRLQAEGIAGEQRATQALADADLQLHRRELGLSPVATHPAKS